MNNQLILIDFALVMVNINNHPYFIGINKSHCSTVLFSRHFPLCKHYHLYRFNINGF